MSILGDKQHFIAVFSHKAVDGSSAEIELHYHETLEDLVDFYIADYDEEMHDLEVWEVNPVEQTISIINAEAARIWVESQAEYWQSEDEAGSFALEYFDGDIQDAIDEVNGLAADCDNSQHRLLKSEVL